MQRHGLAGEAGKLGGARRLGLRAARRRPSMASGRGGPLAAKTATWVTPGAKTIRGRGAATLVLKN